MGLIIIYAVIVAISATTMAYTSRSSTSAQCGSNVPKYIIESSLLLLVPVQLPMPPLSNQDSDLSQGLINETHLDDE